MLEPWRGAGIPGDRGAASAAGEQEGSTAALGHGAGNTPELRNPSAVCLYHPSSSWAGTASSCTAEPRTAALQTHLRTSDFITVANNKEVQMRMIILLVLHAEGQRARISHSPV